MHSFRHESSGVVIHYNGDYSCDAKVVVPRSFYEHPSYDDSGNQWLTIPCVVLSEFSLSLTVSQIISMLENWDDDLLRS